MVAFSLPTFVTGLELSREMAIQTLGLAIGLGSMVVFAIGAVMGAIGSMTRLSSYLLVRIAFGDRGAGIVNIAFAISLLGWYGVNINLFGGAVSKLAQTLWQVDIPVIWLSLFASACMTSTALVGFRAINWLSTLLIPVLAIVTVLLARAAFSGFNMETALAREEVGVLSLGDGVSVIVGAVIIGAIILPDITRFIRHWSGAVYTAFITYVAVQILVTGTAAVAGSVMGQSDILDIMLAINLGFGAFAIVIAGSWVLNSLNLYSAVLSTKATFPKLPTTALTLVMGVAGVVAALMNILDQFITFLFYLSVVFVPVAGVIIVDFLAIRRDAYRIETLNDNRNLNAKAFIAWAVGAAFSIATAEEIIPALSGMAAVDAIALSALSYLLMSWNERGSGAIAS